MGNTMLRGLLITAVLLVVILSIGLSSGETYIVDDDWDGADSGSLSWAIYTANDNDTIRVHAGTYWLSRLSILDSITIIGNGSSNTFLKFDYSGLGIYEPGVSISGFTMSTNSTYDDLIHSRDGTFLIEDCVLINGSMDLSRSEDYSKNEIRNVTILNAPYTAIVTSGSTLIVDSVIDRTGYGLGILGPTVAKNVTISNCTMGSIFIDETTYISGCELFGSGVVIGEEVAIEDIIIENTTVDGRPLIIIHDQTDMLYSDIAGQIIINNCSNITIVDQNGLNSIIAEDCHDLLVKDSTITGASTGMIFKDCHNVYIDNVTIETDLSDFELYRTDLTAVNSTFLSEDGLDVEYANDLTLMNCVIRGGLDYNIYFEARVRSYSLVNCSTLTGRYLVLVDEEDQTYDGVGGMIAVSCKNITVQNSLMLEGDGIRVYSSSNITVRNITCEGIQKGIRMEGINDVVIDSLSVQNSTEGLYLTNGQRLRIGNVNILNILRKYYISSYPTIGFYIADFDNVTISDCIVDNAYLRLRVNDDVNIADSRFQLVSSGFNWYYVLPSELDIGNNGSIVNTTLISNFISISGSNASMSFDHSSVSEVGPESYIRIGGNGNEIADVNGVGFANQSFEIIGNDNSIDGIELNRMTGDLIVTGDRNRFDDVVINGTGSVQIDGNDNRFKECSITNRTLIILSGDSRFTDCSIEASDFIVFVRGTNRFTECDISGDIFVEPLGTMGFMESEFKNCSIDGEFPTLVVSEVETVITEDSTQLILVNCSDVTIRDMMIAPLMGAVMVWDSDNISIMNLTLDGGSGYDFPYPLSSQFTSDGLYIDSCSNVMISNCSITDHYVGISLIDCYQVDISLVNVSHNEFGFLIYDTEELNITRSWMYANLESGIKTYETNGEIYFNDFVRNHENIDAAGIEKIYWWNNHYSRWTTDENEDGIVDHHYYIRTDTYDFSPLSRSFTTYIEPPGDIDGIPVISIDERTSKKVNVGTSFYIIFNVTEDRGNIFTVEMKVNGGNWTEVRPNVDHVNLTSFMLTLRLWADDYGSGRHSFEIRVSDGAHYSDIIEQEIVIRNPHKDTSDHPLEIDSSMVLQNSILFLAAVILVVLLLRIVKRKRMMEERRETRSLPKDEGGPISPMKGKKVKRPPIVNSSKPPSKRRTTRK